MKIIDKSLFDDNDLKLIEILIANIDFKDLLLTLRAILKTPIAGFSFTGRGTNNILQARYDFFNDKSKFEMLVKSSFFIINAFNLPKKWLTSMAHLILNDEIIPPNLPIKFSSKDNLVVIEISEGMSISSLIESLTLLNKNKELTKKLETLPNPKKKLSLHKLQNIKLNQEMISLKAKGLSNKDIAVAIDETFDEQKVCKYMSRYKVVEKKLKNDNNPYSDLLSKNTKNADNNFDIDRYFTVSEILKTNKI